MGNMCLVFEKELEGWVRCPCVCENLMVIAIHYSTWEHVQSPNIRCKLEFSRKYNRTKLSA